MYPHTRFYSPVIAKKASVEPFESPLSSVCNDKVARKACISPGTACSDNVTSSTASVTSFSSMTIESSRSTRKLLRPMPTLCDSPTVSDQVKHAKLMQHLQARGITSPSKSRVGFKSPLSIGLQSPTTSSFTEYSSTDVVHSEQTERKEEYVRKQNRAPLGRRMNSPRTSPGRKRVSRITPFDLTLKRAQIQAKSIQARRGSDSFMHDASSNSISKSRITSRRTTSKHGLKHRIQGIEDKIGNNVALPSLFSVPCLFVEDDESAFTEQCDGLNDMTKDVVHRFQARVRGFLARCRLRLMSRSATKIQAFVRRVICQRKYRINCLSIRLADVHQRRRKSLVLIQLETLKRKEACRYRMIEKAKRKEKQLDELLESRQKVIKYLEDENRKILVQNLKMEVVMHRLLQMNEQTEKSTKVYNENFQTLWKTIEVLSKQEERLQTREDRYRKRIDKQMANMAATRARSMTETKVRKTLEQGLIEVVKHFEEKCGNEDLVKKIVAIGDGECDDDTADGYLTVASSDDEEEGFLLTWCIDDEDSISSDITSLQEADNFEVEELFDEEYVDSVVQLATDEDDQQDEDAASALDDCTCQSSVWIETHSIIM